MSAADTHAAIDAIWRIESSKIIAYLTRMVRDIGLAEDLAQDALIAALERWPQDGIPDNPGGWLMTAAKRKALDLLRRNKVRDQKYEQLGRDMDSQIDSEFEVPEEGEVSDDILRLIFMTCHPVLSPEARVALTLRLLGGLTTAEIAHAYLVPEPTIAQRIVRAKRTLSATRVAFEIPQGAELKPRLSSVLEVIYLMFNEGYAASSGSQWIRPLLCQEALRIGRVLAEIVPTEAEVHGLVALMEFQSSRFKSRVNAQGDPVLLMDQNRALWDYILIRRGFAALDRIERLGGMTGPYAIQAAISACHAGAPSAAETDWIRISALYEALAQVSPSPIVELNRAVALSMAFGPEIGLEIVDVLQSEPALKGYHLLPSVRGDMLFKLGRMDEACAEFKLAASLTDNSKERALLLNRAAECLSTEP
ncbi:RNA polymerase sigma factor [Paenibacillus solani]|uniref:RNA polymerase sigma factor n=1 Tax=Paenibacillus solani TaxID=1705565 RepID=UPI003D2D7832